LTIESRLYGFVNNTSIDASMVEITIRYTYGQTKRVYINRASGSNCYYRIIDQKTTSDDFVLESQAGDDNNPMNALVLKMNKVL